jgi:hypothetical protein
MKDRYHPQTGDASNLATAHTDSTHYQQIVQAGYPGEMTQRFDGEALRLTADFEIVTPRPSAASIRAEDLGLELAKVRRLDPDPGSALSRTKIRKQYERRSTWQRGVRPGQSWLASWAATAAG